MAPAYKTLITLNGTAPYDDSFSFEVIEGGTLKIIGRNGAEDLIGPGFWVGVRDEAGEGRLDWEFLAPQPVSD